MSGSFDDIIRQPALQQAAAAVRSIAQSAPNASGAALAPTTGAPLQVAPLQQTVSPAPPTAPENLQDASGRRVRIRAKPGAINDIYGNGIMKPLLRTNGMVFPYQPIITYQPEIVYSTTEMVHANQDFQSYSKTPAVRIGVEGDFTVQSPSEGLYALACIHFLRTVTKMWFGGQSEEAINKQGTPPPVLLFDAFGQYMFNALPVVITSFGVSFPKDVDYYPVSYNENSTETPIPNQDYNVFSRINEQPINGSTNYTWLPVQFIITVQLVVQNTPQRLRTFDLASFRSGDLLKGGGWI